MKLIGITGGSGSGKTTITEILKEYNVFIINADKVVKNLTSKKTEYLEKIIEVFGEEILDKNNKLNRKKLSNIIFSDKLKKQKLNNLTSIYVTAEINKIINLNKNKELILLDAPLLFESGLDKECDIIISVISNIENRVNRISERDNISIENANKRVGAQEKDEFYINKSDYVIYNNNDIIYLKNQINNIVKLVLKNK